MFFVLVALDGSKNALQQLVSVISLLSSDTPNLESPANVDAAKEVRTDPAGKLSPIFVTSTLYHLF
jgi:ubiquitin-protein ligase